MTITESLANPCVTVIVVPVPEIRGKEKFRKINEGTWEIDEGSSVEIALTDGISSLIYTLDGIDPQSSMTQKKASENVILSEVFANKSAVQILARGFDESGNHSDLVKSSVVNKKKEYEVIVEKDDLFNKKGTFKIPGSLEALKSVLSSTVERALKDEVITEAQAQELRNAFDEL